MILCTLTDAKRFGTLHQGINDIINYVLSHDMSSANKGRISVNGDKVFINVEDGMLCEADERLLEAHRRYLDIHIPLTNDEIIGWRAISNLDTESYEPFNTERDIAFYKEAASQYVTVHKGECCILFPEDAHAPLIGKGSIRKLVGKVLL